MSTDNDPLQKIILIIIVLLSYKIIKNIRNLSYFKKKDNIE